ncbi:unnamed protein product [Trifolium pratense]|uniref:Uncharacterized protein n=1 Tax=Trifolium pratense TaxID=57577 RepID=A0ACB0JIA2_TRIPR|nr:unnamed protein product [Trifolium pratense]
MIEDVEGNALGLVRSCVPDEVLSNWEAKEIPAISFKSTDIPFETYTARVPIDFELPINQAEEVDEDDCEILEGLARLLKQEEKMIQPHQELVEVINLGTDVDRKEVKIGASLQEDVKRNLVSLLQEYVDVFAWSYQDMPRLDTDIVVHKLPLRPECPPVKQKMRRTRPDMALKIREEVMKQFDAGFLAVSKYPQWVANIVPVPKKDGKAIKGSVLSEYLAHQPLEEHQPVQSDFPDEDIMVLEKEKVIGDEEGSEPGARWKLVFDGASNAMGHGIGAVLISPRDGYKPFAARLGFDCTNNMAEYEACIMGLEAAVDLRIKILEVYGDSALVICQVKGEWETRHPKLIPYCARVMELAKHFDEITFHHIPREENQVADALATLSSMYKVNFHNEAPLIKVDYKYEPTVYTVIADGCDSKPWFYDIKRYLERQEYPENASTNDKKTLRRLASQFFLNGEVLYKRNHDMVLLRCVDRQEADLLLAEIHEGSFGTHANGHAMAKKILRAGYYWLTMEADCFRYVKTCHKCQIYADKVHLGCH